MTVGTLSFHQIRSDEGAGGGLPFSEHDCKHGTRSGADEISRRKLIFSALRVSIQLAHFEITMKCKINYTGCDYHNTNEFHV